MGTKEYRRTEKRMIAIIILLTLVSIAAGIYSFCVSQYPITFSESIDIIRKNLAGEAFGTYKERLKSFIVWDSNVPIAIGTLLVGTILGISGCVMQTVIRNPVADPYTTGISSGALLGVTCYIVLGISVTGVAGHIGMIANAFLFSLVPVGIIILFSVFRKVTPTVMILIGIAVMYIFSATTTLLKYTATEDDIAAIYAWSVGTLSNIVWSNIPYLIVAAFGLFLVMMYLSNHMNVLISGDKTATALGVDPTRIRLVSLILTSVAVSVAVCFTGTIGFIGLISPHISRTVVGSNAKILIPCSAVVGAILLISSEMLARMIGNMGMSVGVVTSLIGAPIFLMFLIKQKKGTW